MKISRETAAGYRLEDRYLARSGRVFLTGTQALVRILIDQARRDREAGLDSAGFVSGYRGSPLGGLDGALWKAGALLAEHRIEFLPAVNEDLAATAVLGSQQVETDPARRVSAAFAMWYGKGPGVDRSGDALKHGNAFGASPNGGVLVVAGDDHGCVSSSMGHQSDAAFLSWFMPVLHPADVGEYLEFGAYGYALSRFSGAWVGFKAISEVVESARSVTLQPDRVFSRPDFEIPADGLHYRWPDLPGPQIEARLEAKKHAVLAFAAANPVDRVIHGIRGGRFGIVTTGKAHHDLMEALRLLGLDRAECARLGIDIYKVGMVWPLERKGALDFVRGKQEVLVVEEKRGIIESQLKEYFYDWPGDKPRRMVGKHDGAGNRLIPWTGELSPRQLVPLLAARLDGLFPEQRFPERARALAPPPMLLDVAGATRTPYFCSGCPHNTSTRLPEGSKAQAGIGCHVMASWMNRETGVLTQMGGEGVNRAGLARFAGNGHVFQNLGEGTWYHSGALAIRQAVAAGINITYKILYNDAVAMTGGQPVDGPVSVQAIAHACRAEGVARIALVSDAPEKFARRDFPPGTSIDHRDRLDAVQRALRDTPGTTVLIYEQTCATEKRRRRKRGQLEDPPRFVVINPLVCEGCGDCSVASNCLSVEPLETELGRKRRINLSSCNKDFSCLDGFCPSFVVVENATRRRPEGPGTAALEQVAALPEPEITPLAGPYDLLVTGVGGTGVVTVGALISMAAHLQGMGASALDFTGFAQKFGPVLSYLRLGPAPESIHQSRVDAGAADAVIACDIVTATSPRASACYRRGSRVALNTAAMPTGDLVLSPDADLRVQTREQTLRQAVGPENVSAFDANAAAERMLGDSVFANVMMLGFAWQKGLVPLRQEALERAIRLNGVMVERNLQAFALGRLLAERPAPAAAPAPDTDALIAARAEFLRDYQDAAYAARYRERLDRLRRALPGEDCAPLHQAAARALFRLMAIKDEYEVARLFTETGFDAHLDSLFEPGYRVSYRFAAPLVSRGLDARGRPKKRRFGPWVRPALRLLARARRLRGTPADPFRLTADGRLNHALLAWYESLLERAGHACTPDSRARWQEILAAPERIRGYGPVRMKAAQEVRRRVDSLLTEAP